VQPAALPLLILAEPLAPVAAWLGAQVAPAVRKRLAPAAGPETEDAAGEQPIEVVVRAQPASAVPGLPVEPQR
jgi:hypothetical protein